MLNNNQIAESVAILVLSAASVFTPLSSLFNENDNDADQSHAFVMIEPENLAGPTTVTKGTSFAMVSPVDSSVESPMETPMILVEFDHEVSGDHPRHTDWCEASRMIQNNP